MPPPSKEADFVRGGRVGNVLDAQTVIGGNVGVITCYRRAFHIGDNLCPVKGVEGS
jgi:hypothetical protein